MVGSRAMAKKDKKSKKGKKSSAKPADALRDAVERTFRRAAGGRSRAEAAPRIFDELTPRSTRLREP